MQSGAPVNSLRSDKPCAPLNNISLPLRFSADSSKVTSPGHPLFPESILKLSAPLPAHSQTEMLLTKQTENAATARLVDFRYEKSSGRALLTEAYKFINFHFEKIRKQPHFKKNSAGMEDGGG